MPSPNSFSCKSPVQAWRIARNEITSRGGSVTAFGHQGYSLSYTGPDVAVSPVADIHIPFPPRIDNLDRANWMVAKLSSPSTPFVWLDGSPIGKFLFVDNQLYTGLNEYFASIGVTDLKIIRAGGDYVMSRISRSYIKSTYGYAATAVCGAKHDRIFFVYEMPPLVSNKQIFEVNSLPRAMVADFYAINKDEAFQLICWAELLLSKHRLDLDGSDENRRDFLQRQYFLNGERKLTLSKVTPLSKKWEIKREEKRHEIFSNHKNSIRHAALKGILTDIRPLCPTIIYTPSHTTAKRFVP